MEERFHFRHVHAITGTFVLLVMAVLVTALVFAGRSQRWFIGSVPLRIVLPEGGAAGIRQGSEVYFLGTLMGGVSDVSVDSTGRMEAQVDIRRDFFLFVRADSSAVVKRKFGVVGDAYFEITRGHGATLPEKNAKIVCNEQLPSALESAVEEIRREAVPALKKLSIGLDSWTLLGSNLTASTKRLDRLLDRADSLALGLQNGEGTVGQLLTDPSVAEELKTLVVHANETMAELKETLDNVRTASGNWSRASTNWPAISGIVGKEVEQLPGLVSQTQESMRELERLIKGMQRHWFLRRYMRPDPPPEGEGRSRVVPPTKKHPVIRSPKDAGR